MHFSELGILLSIIAVNLASKATVCLLTPWSGHEASSIVIIRLQAKFIVIDDPANPRVDDRT